MTLFNRAALGLLAACLLTPAVASAQTIRIFGTDVPIQALGFGDIGGAVTAVTAANPLPVAIISGGGGGGSGTEYTEDGVAVVNPVGGTIVCRRKDTLSGAEVSADGDWVGINCTAKGEQHVKATDTDALLTTQAGYLDGVETAIASTNTKLDTLDTRVDGLEAALTTANAHLTDIETAAEDTTTPVPITATACTLAGYQSAASTNATNVKASAGTYCGGLAINTTASLYYLRLYDLAAAPTCSSATGFVVSIPIPASTTGNGTSLNLGPYGAAFSAGIGFCLTASGTSTANDNAATGVYLALTTR